MNTSYPSHVLMVYKGEDKQWYWHVEAANGEIVAQGEGYKRRMTMLESVYHLFAGSEIGTQALNLIDKYRRK